MIEDHHLYVSNIYIHLVELYWSKWTERNGKKKRRQRGHIHTHKKKEKSEILQILFCDWKSLLSSAIQPSKLWHCSHHHFHHGWWIFPLSFSFSLSLPFLCALVSWVISMLHIMISVNGTVNSLFHTATDVYYIAHTKMWIHTKHHLLWKFYSFFLLYTLCVCLYVIQFSNVLTYSLIFLGWKFSPHVMMWCVCVCVWEREREREREHKVHKNDQLNTTIGSCLIFCPFIRIVILSGTNNMNWWTHYPWVSN